MQVVNGSGKVSERQLARRLAGTVIKLALGTGEVKSEINCLRREDSTGSGVSKQLARRM